MVINLNVGKIFCGLSH